ncbi:DoxX family protein [Paenibacillus sp. FSL R7-0302]|uniref:DoxX family protein n=1 Tax=Paenibacillus sp. FSL R7-0302 TaxID=2921681 RepID=UPI0030F97325
MNIALWVVQVITAIGFVYSGGLKAFQYEKAKASWGWVKDVPQALVVLIGLAELLGALGIILPYATKIAPVLTPIAATGLAVIVLCGALFHVSRKEYRELGVNIVFIALAVIIAVTRYSTAT